MKLSIYQADAFTSELFGGNPAAICPLESWLPDELMQKIALENNLSETAFFVRKNDGFEIRWFTPKTEVALCGHATLATAFILFNQLGFDKDEVVFTTLESGNLIVRRKEDLLTLDFPKDHITKTEPLPQLLNAFNFKPVEFYKGKTKFMLVFQNEEEIINIKPDFKTISEFAQGGVIVTAAGKEVDFVSRFFAPYAGVDEDPVTGSAHTALIPYWSKVLEKNELTAIQLSERKGFLKCVNKTNGVEMSGECRLYLKGEIFIS
jgi:PhzF family phenazine biosynthesis protein